MLTGPSPPHYSHTFGANHIEELQDAPDVEDTAIERLYDLDVEKSLRGLATIGDTGTHM